jgi:hypothetical protein
LSENTTFVSFIGIYFQTKTLLFLPLFYIFYFEAATIINWLGELPGRFSIRLFPFGSRGGPESYLGT